MMQNFSVLIGCQCGKFPILGGPGRYTLNEYVLPELCGGKPHSEEVDDFPVSFFFLPEWFLGGFPGWWL